MELYERVKTVAKHFSGSDKALAERLGVRQNTFSYYLTLKSQNNLWPLLPRILELFPDVSREWLYFGEGEMAGNASAATPFPIIRDPMQADKDAGELRARIADLEAALRAKDAELTEERRLNRTLTTRLLVDGVGDKGGSPHTGLAADGPK